MVYYKRCFVSCDHPYQYFILLFICDCCITMPQACVRKRHIFNCKPVHICGKNLICFPGMLPIATTKRYKLSSVTLDSTQRFIRYRNTPCIVSHPLMQVLSSEGDAELPLKKRVRKCCNGINWMFFEDALQLFALH